jgi:surface protein
MNTRELYIKAQKPSVAEWVRPSDWLPMPTNITESDEIFVGLHAVIEDNDNYVAFLFTTSTGQYQVDWGDGSTPTLHDSNTIAQYEYDFATVSNSTLTSRGYKQAIITVTPVSGNLLTCDFQRRFVTTPAQNQPYSTGFLDCILSMPNANTGTSITFGGGTVRHRYVERFDVKTIGNCTNMGNMFQGCNSLQQVPLFNTANVTNMNNMFVICSSLQQVPLFNTANVTNMSVMFNGCFSLQQVPLFNTSNVTNMSVMFLNCSSLQQVPLFNTQNVTNMSVMFQGCNSLQQVPLFNTSNVTNMSSMFQSCSSLQQLPLFNTQNVTGMGSMFQGCSSLNSIPSLSTQSITTTSGTDFGVNFATGSNSLNRCQMVFARTVSFANCQLSRDALVEIFTNLVDRSSTTSANINISGNWGATALSTADRDIALNKNWTITG